MVMEYHQLCVIVYVMMKIESMAERSAVTLRGLFSGKAEKVSAELEHAEQVMLEHEKQNFSDKPTKSHKEKDDVKDSEKYKSLYSSFDVLKSHEDLPDGLVKVFQQGSVMNVFK